MKARPPRRTVGAWQPGHDAIALGLGLGLLAACGLVTVTNFRVPSTVLALLERGLRNGPLAT